MEQTWLCVFAGLVLLGGASGCEIEPGTLLRASRRNVRTVAYNLSGDSWSQVGAVEFEAPTPGEWQYQTIYKEMRGDKAYLCMAPIAGIDPCRRQDTEDTARTTNLFGDCFWWKTGMTKIVRKQMGMKYGLQTPCLKPSGAQDFFPQGASNTEWTLEAGKSKGSLTLSLVEDRAEDGCKGQTPRRGRRLEKVTLWVVSGCALGAAPAGGCDKGVATCKPCRDDQVAAYSWHGVAGSLGYCINKRSKCTVGDDFYGCPDGFWGAAVANNSTVECRPCEPGTYRSWLINIRSNYMGRVGGPLLLSRCNPCTKLTDSGWAASMCEACNPGQYAKSDFHPIMCTKCPKGTFGPPFRPAWTNKTNTCFKCPQGMYQDEEGRQTCKICTTPWRCYPEKSVELGKFADVPFRFNGPLGEPECLSQDGKNCWRDESVKCSDKVKRAPELEKAGKLKPLACGAMHKKIWGSDGYSEQGHWCPGIVDAFLPSGAGRPVGYKNEFWGMPPAPKDGTATGAAAAGACKARMGW